MNTTKIHKFLRELSPEEYSYLRLSTSYAGYIWSIQSRFVLSDEEMIKRLKVTKKRFHDMKIGATTLSLTDIAKLEAIEKDEIINTQSVEIKLAPKESNG